MTAREIPAFMLTASGREDILAGTLARWAAAGGGAAPVVVVDPTPPEERPLTRLFGGWRSLLERAVADSPAPHVLLLEDDLDFVPGFREKVAAWSPLVAGRVTAFASFFNPGVGRWFSDSADGEGPDFFSAHPYEVVGSQALLLARKFAALALGKWDLLEGFPVMKFGELAALLDRPVYYHRPSLVQHTGTVSAWGGFLRRAVDFPGREPA